MRIRTSYTSIIRGFGDADGEEGGGEEEDGDAGLVDTGEHPTPTPGGDGLSRFRYTDEGGRLCRTDLEEGEGMASEAALRLGPMWVWGVEGSRGADTSQATRRGLLKEYPIPRPRHGSPCPLPLS